MSLGSGYSGPAGESKADQKFELITGPPFTSYPIPIEVTLDPSLFSLTPKVGKRGSLTV